MKILKKYKYIIISIGVLLVLAIIGFSYAYYNANVTIVSDTQTIIRSKKLSLTFYDTKEINSTDMMPGKVVEKTFNVVSTADDDITYNIKFNEITNTYNEDVVFTLIKDGKEVVTQTPLPDTAEKDYVYTNISIEPNVTHDYVLRITYLNTDKEQVLGKDDIFIGTVEIDVEEVTKELVYVPYVTNQITSTDTETPDDSQQEQTNTITNEFTVKNTSAVQTQRYNVLLDELTNEYEEGELTYSLIKNGEEISSGNVPQEGELPYLTTDEKLTTGQTDTYNLTITENVDDTIAYVKERYKFSLLSNELAQTKALSKKFSAKIIIDEKEVDTTAPEAKLEFVSKTTNTATFKASCIDEESGIISYKFYKNGSLIETKETDEENIEYTYEKLEKKEHEFKLVCTNSFKVETNATQRVTPTGLISPVYTVASGAAQSKNVDITYTAAGTYLFKINGEVTSNIDVIDCGTVSNEAEFSCSETKVEKGTKLSENIWYKVDSNPTLTFTSNGNIVAKVVDGTNYVLGEELQIEGIDREVPSIPEVESEYALGSWTNKEVTLKVSSTDNEEVAYYEYKVGDSSWSKVTGNEIKFTEDMEELVSIRAIDTAENISEVKEVEVKIDTTKPNIVFETNGSTTWSKSQSTKVSASDIAEISELKYQWTQSATAPTESSFTTEFTNGGTITKNTGTGNDWYLWVYAKDSAGNITITKSNVFYIDNTEPSSCTISGNPTSWATSATLTVTGADANSGLHATQPYSWDGSTYSTTQTKGVTNGTYTAYVKDKAGNIKSCSVTVSKVDESAPSEPVLGTVSNYGKSLTVAFTPGVDSESGITHTCYYAKIITSDGLTPIPTTAGTVSGTTCIFNNLSQGTKYVYQVCAENGAGIQVCSSVKESTTYTGVAAGTYTTGSTVSYGGLSWYVLGDTGSSKGSYLKLVQNGVTGSGTYNNANTYLNGTFLTNYSAINTDKSRGGLVAQGSNYVTTDSGTTAYRPGYVYWNKSGYVVIPNAVSKYALSSLTYRVKGRAVNNGVESDSGNHFNYYAGVTSSTLYSAGQNVALANTSSTITYTNGGYTTSTLQYSSPYTIEIMPTEYENSSGNTVAPTSSRIPIMVDRYQLTSTGGVTLQSEATNSSASWEIVTCSNEGYVHTMKATSATKYSSTYNSSTVTRSYSNSDYFSYAGRATSSGDSTKKTFNLKNTNCTQPTGYTLKNTSATVYYRPYILVREAYAS